MSKSPRTPPKIVLIKSEPNSINIPNSLRKREGMSLNIPNSELGSLSCQNSPEKKSTLINNSPKTPNVYRNNSFQVEGDDSKQKGIRAYSFASKKSLDLGSSKSLSTINERLEVIKKQTDDDCKLFEKELTETKKPPKEHQNFQFCINIESQLSIFSQKIQKTSINDLKEGQYRNIMDELTKLNRTTELTKNVDEYVKECRKMIRKLIFIFSRCSRILELLRQSQIQTKQKMDSVYDQKEPKEPTKSTLGNLLSKFGFGSKEPSSPKEQIQTTMVCRICEESISSKGFESHSKICQSRQNVEVKENQIEDKIKKITSIIKKDLKSRKEDTFEYQVLHGLFTVAKTTYESPFDLNGYQDLQLLMEDIKDIQNSNPKDREIITYITKLEQYIISKMEITLERVKVGGETKPKKRIKITDFDIIKNIGAGAYGRVFLARKKNTKDLFAIKTLKKEEIHKKKQYKRILAERNIMAVTSNNFVVKMYYSFQGKEYLYIVMEYLRGGDLHSLLKKEGYFEENIARQYTAEIVLALEYIHSLKIVHRDLKPDNILIGNDGHLKLTDFGLSEIGLYQSDFFLDDIIPDKSPNTQEGSPSEDLEIFGTPDYLAPELLLGIEHSFGVDLWALGVLIFELLTGCPPFNDQTPEDIFDNILSLDIPWPEEGLLPESGIDLIKKLLVLDPKDRLNIQQVKNHKFFANVNWKNVLNQKPEYIPQMDDEDFNNSINIDEFKNDVEQSRNSLRNDSFLSVSPKATLGFSFINTSNLAKKNEEEMNKNKEL